jgi:hypothetical protein
MAVNLIVPSAVSAVVSIGILLLRQPLERRAEVQKAKLGRASWVHQKQVDALMRLYKSLYDMQESFQAFTRGRAEPLELRYSQDAKSAWAVFIESKLLFPTNVIETCDGVFKKIREAQLAVMNSTAFKVAGDASGGADELKNALVIAHTQIPELLREIEFAAREIIDGETRMEGQR